MIKQGILQKGQGASSADQGSAALFWMQFTLNLPIRPNTKPLSKS
jgi:hypothetical protein